MARTKASFPPSTLSFIFLSFFLLYFYFVCTTVLFPT
ncbi:hypothetical protein BC936DRAFT_146576 [Jimgerdemannia flammicorona]|uniref:Uncharacterized protein n=1 Tax=Jimgerdemannia flammicorona TaxID=994334 RepID=A0A433D788_9FUNG|nr:hypothetical protein BC936DRAFT_146576 [Jimgerdemannia flammicorona]